MNRSERASQIWAVLALAAGNRQSLTYGMLSRLIGVPAAGMGRLLEPIQSYCILQDLPPLTLLVVQKSSGLPGRGFIGAKAADYARDQMRIFAYDWLAHGNPQAEKLEQAVLELPSNGEEIDSDE
ncbi:hypothetical protein RTH46_14450 [Pseudomonas sp. zfem004]|uniref:hypothetical protein n=1 Tax=Pseudomonas sp. zfem004 TaxID=3078199 RepID=UPI002927C03A|nr:hypothetical protein [Pseudomonas sp. zfem004]MDU9403690.1 hypothetical protein [Pseudomonas sp. zfem004]